MARLRRNVEERVLDLGRQVSDQAALELPVSIIDDEVIIAALVDAVRLGGVVEGLGIPAGVDDAVAC